MQSHGGDSVLSKMEQLRLNCEYDYIPIEQHEVESATLSTRESIESSKALAQQALQLDEKLGKLKFELRETEDNLVKALAVKTQKEAKRIALAQSIAATKARVEECRGIVENQRARKDEYAAIISQQTDALKACEEKHNQTAEHKAEIEEAIAWYNKVLGLRIECGYGVKFIFTKIDPNNEDKEYFFTVRHKNDVYTLIDCDPQLDDANELVSELNKTNGLFKFARTMREKFQATLTHGNTADIAIGDQDTSIISMSAPTSSVSTDTRSQFSSQIEVHQPHQPDEYNRSAKKLNRGKVGQVAVLSPGSASSLRRSPRLRSKDDNNYQGVSSFEMPAC